MNNLPKGFDYMFYSNYHNDLFNAFSYNKQLLEFHYIKNGRFEHRKYCDVPDNFNWKKYILCNRDIFDVIEKCTKENAIYHYLTNNTNLVHNYIDNNNDNNNNDDNNDNNNDKSNKDINDSNSTDIYTLRDKPIYILYYAYLYQDIKWKNIVGGQMRDILNSGILKMSKLHAVLLGTPTEIQEAKLLIEQITNETIDITEVYENKYEFPAIVKIRELALTNPDKIFIYLHSKGMVNWNNTQYRTLIEEKLTKSTLLNWDTTLFIFNHFPEIQKAGILPAENGWIWYNFWWARGSYLISCSPIEIPINLVEPDRYMCEDWLGRNGSKTWTDCYSFVTKNISYSKDPSGEVFPCTVII
jgi:hypothetical protein